jgi:hypothetical protein
VHRGRHDEPAARERHPGLKKPHPDPPKTNHVTGV